MTAVDPLADVAAVAVHGRGDHRERAALELTGCSADPRAFAWWWLWLASAPPEAVARLVDELPCRLVLPLSSVSAAVDAMTSHDDPTCSAWVGVRNAVLRRLDPQDPGSCDLATLLACSPDTHPDVLVAALELLAAAGHPSRRALLRAAEAAVQHAAPAASPGSTARLDPDAVAAAAALLAALAPPADEQQRQLAARCARLVEACARPAAGASAGPSWDPRDAWVGAVLTRLRS